MRNCSLTFEQLPAPPADPAQAKPADNLQEQLYQSIRADLLAGRYRPGQALKIRDLARQWGTSAMPVRTALQRLVAEGALEGEPQRSMRVPAMTRERYEQLLSVRLALEGLAVDLAVPRLTRDDLRCLRNCVETMQDAVQKGSIEQYLSHNSHFHLHLYQRCENPLLLRLIDSLWLQVGPFFNRLFSEADLSLRLNQFHGDVLDALERGDGAAARQALEQDLKYFGHYLLGLLALEEEQRV
ncbi:GntR family transcriptional regulator [Zestomonas carbonaria]|uniref:HTH-type transcriptional regulator McbR n=1 Tax=Zestomonas carbonaria TaxID=2762745 RepID=A0A7U7ELC3_9GAMM|nr:GntR family transcriptional regulator [Pseudomonas carbonaria]CAD5107134.1 HTH-type transcriptional regulator McbR [Pseudomonas carbonaria]